MNAIRFELRWAAIISAVQICWMVAERLIGLHDQLIAYHSWSQTLYKLPLIILFFIALRNIMTEKYGGRMLWREGFTSGVILCTMLALIAPVIQMIMHQLISPEYFSRMIEYASQQAIMTPEEAKAYFNVKRQAMQSVFTAFMFSIFSCGIISMYLAEQSKPSR